MATLIQHIKRYRLLGILLVIVCLTIKGCEHFTESSFTLANDSRLPKWVALPPNLSRANASLTMNYLTVPWSTAQFILRNKNGHILKKDNGRMRCSGPIKLINPPPGFPSGYPAYEAITVHGITEIIEHRKMEPIFYVTDDPAVWKQYESTGCS
jgi:hypothetical protein